MTSVRAIATGCLAGALLCLSPSVLAQETQAEDDTNIVVTGRVEQPTAREVNRQARTITYGGNLLHAPLARFEDRLCPGILGMKPEYASLMIDRIRYHAQQLDIRLADDTTCTPNFVVAFVDNGQAELLSIAESHGYLFSTLSKSERDDLLREDGPARVWTITEPRTRDGMPIPRNEGGDPPVASMWMAHSKIYTATREDITSVMVLVNRAHAPGKSLVQLADYATMRGLARTRPVEDRTSMDTILALFDGTAVPPSEMTEFDRAYLASLYNGIPNLPGAVKVGGVGRQLRRQLSAAEPQE